MEIEHIPWVLGNLEDFGQEAAIHERLGQIMRFPILREAFVSSSRTRAEKEAERYIRDEYLHYSGYDLEYFDRMFEDLRQKAFLWGSPATLQPASRLSPAVDSTTSCSACHGSACPFTMKSLEIMARVVLFRYSRKPPPHSPL
ncbi:MAG: hypothetical protein OXI56_13090 [bacterium]|nr:hypothetical protein [bacterium]